DRSGRGRRGRTRHGLQIDRAHLPRPPGLRPDHCGRDDAVRELVDGRDLAGVEPGAGDPDAIADLETGPAGSRREVDRRYRRPGAGDLRGAGVTGGGLTGRGSRRRVGRAALAGWHWLGGPPFGAVTAHAVCHTELTPPSPPGPPPRRRTTAAASPSRRGSG